MESLEGGGWKEFSTVFSNSGCLLTAYSALNSVPQLELFTDMKILAQLETINMYIWYDS